MRRANWIATSAVLLGLAVPTSAFAQAPSGDSVTGNAFDCLQVLSSGFCTSASVTTDAHSGPGGENPTGTIRYGFSGGTPSSTSSGFGDVTCLSVAGNVATIGFAGFEDQGDGFIVYSAGFVTVVDAGAADSKLDRFGLLYTWFDPSGPRPGPTDCTTPGATPYVNDRGDLTVVNTQALPTSKDQCKNGGWKTYGVFKNEGDCVSFVRHHARLACIFERVAHGVRAFRDKYGMAYQGLDAIERCVKSWVRGEQPQVAAA